MSGILAGLVSEALASTRPEEVAEVVKKAVENPAIFTFGELLDCAPVRQLSQTPLSPYVTLLSLFAYGTFADYVSQRASLPEISPRAVLKLKQLSVVELCTKLSSLPYAMLQTELDIGSVRELEDLLIEVIYAGLVKGTLDQQKAALFVDSAMGRDVRPGQLQDIIQRLTQWMAVTEETAKSLDEQVMHTRQAVNTAAQQKREFEAELAKLAAQEANNESDDRRVSEYSSIEYEEDYRRTAHSASSRARQGRSSASTRR